MARSHPSFDPNQFREAIWTAMRMGSPNVVTDKATFRWRPVRTFAPQDPAHRPYNWGQAPVTDDPHPEVMLEEVAIEYSPISSARAGPVAGTPVGVFAPRVAELTILDTQRAQIVGATEVDVGDSTWTIVGEVVFALFEVDVYQLSLVSQ